MKATQDFRIIVNKARLRVPYKEGDSTKGLEFINVKKGHEIPSEFISDFIAKNLEYVDVLYKDKKPILPKELQPDAPEEPKEMKIKKRKYTQESLNTIYDEQGFSALKKVGEEFGVTDRSSRKLVVEILRAQEERQRAGL